MASNEANRSKISLLAFPMHGQHKLSEEGYRTRDGHFIEWFGQKLAHSGAVGVVSRPEPLPLWLRHKVSHRKIAHNTIDLSPLSMKVPNLRDRRRWWVDSVKDYVVTSPLSDLPAAIWNPFVGLSSWGTTLHKSDSPIVFDLLDDWTIHYAFDSIRSDVTRAYEATFGLVDFVTANSEATLELARKFGRSDAQLLTNGCDPERFRTVSSASGPTTVGYVGKIGRRVDLELIIDVTSRLPDVNFIFAGPILDSEYRGPLSRLPNVSLLGDVHYEDVPNLLQTFDIGWVPHRVGIGEVGGDVIKTYEYRAAGLPVLTTPILGATERGLSHVNVVAPDGHADWLADMIATEGSQRIARKVSVLPSEVSWSDKAQRLLTLLGLDGAKI